MSLGPERSNVSTAAPEQPTRQISLAGTSEHCVSCGAPLALDQRYCVVCGERRGKPRFALAEPHEEPVEKVVTTSSASPARRSRTSAGFNLIAGIATLLLAMGVGVLIGHNSSSSTTGKSNQPAITINGAGAASGAAASTTPSSASGSGSGNAASTGKSKHSKSAKTAKAAAPSKVVVQKAAAAASKVTGGSAKVAAPTDTVGSSCNTGEAGCQNGKLTGNYFGQ